MERTKFRPNLRKILDELMQRLRSYVKQQHFCSRNRASDVSTTKQSPKSPVGCHLYKRCVSLHNPVLFSLYFSDNETILFFFKVSPMYFYLLDVLLMNIFDETINLPLYILTGVLCCIIISAKLIGNWLNAIIPLH